MTAIPTVRASPLGGRAPSVGPAQITVDASVGFTLVNGLPGVGEKVF